MEEEKFSTLLGLISSRLSTFWNIQFISSIRLNLNSKISFKKKKNMRYENINIKIKCLQRKLFLQFFSENEYILEVFERLGYELDFLNIFDELVRYIYLKKLLHKYLFINDETDLSKRVVYIKLQCKGEKKENTFRRKLTTIKKNKTETMNINNLRIDNFKVYVNFFYLIVHSKRHTAISFGQIKNIKIFRTFFYFAFFLGSFSTVTDNFLELPTISCLVVKKSAFFLQLFSKKIHIKNENNLLQKIVCFFYFLSNYIQKPIEYMENLNKFNKNNKVSTLKKCSENTDRKKNSFHFNSKEFSKMVYFLLLKNIYFEIKINRYLVANLSYFIIELYKISRREDLKKYRILKHFRPFDFLQATFKSRNKKCSNIILFISKSTSIFGIRLKIRKLFQDTIYIYNFLEVFFQFHQFLSFFKFFAKALLIKSEFRVKIVSKYEIKKNKFEISIYSEKDTIGYNIPLYLLKNSKVWVNFCIAIKSQWQIFEVFLGNRRHNAINFRPFLVIYPLQDFIESNFTSINTIKEWSAFFILNENEIAKILFPSLIFFGTFSNQQFFGLKAISDLFVRRFYISIYFLKPILTENFLYWKTTWIEQTKLLKINNITSLFFSFSSLIFFFLIENEFI
nr:hypothetical protein 1634Bnrm3_p062 [Cryptomonas sp.]